MSLLFYLISALISLSLPMTIRVSPSVNTCSGPGHGEQVPSMADGQDIDIVAGPHLALQDAVAGPAVRQLDLIDPVFRRQLHIIKDSPG